MPDDIKKMKYSIYTNYVDQNEKAKEKAKVPSSLEFTFAAACITFVLLVESESRLRCLILWASYMVIWPGIGHWK